MPVHLSHCVASPLKCISLPCAEVYYYTSKENQYDGTESLPVEYTGLLGMRHSVAFTIGI
jgi:hypothetical protein